MGEPLRPVCVNCRVFMRCKKNDRCVALQSGGFDYQLWSGDQYQCPECGVSIVTAFGREAMADAGADPERYRTMRDYESGLNNVVVVEG